MSDSDSTDSGSKDDLSAGLAGLAGMLMGRESLEPTLVHIAQLAVRSIPGAQGAGLTLLESDRPQTVVATAPFVREIDDIQYALEEGPCVSAVATRQTVTSGNLGGAQQWPRFGPRVGRLGVHSALSLPLLLGDRVLGALNVYAQGREVFDGRSIEMGEVFAPHAAVSVSNAQILAQAERVVGQLKEALTSRAEIDQAMGVVMSRSGVDAREAFSRLRTMSQDQSLPVSGVARQLIAEASARARARHTDRTDPDPKL